MTEELKPCSMCAGTGYKDHAGFAMDPCDHSEDMLGMVALDNCPFCGASAYLNYDVTTDMFGPEADHKAGCIIRSFSFVEYADAHQAIAAWNTRPSTPPAVSDDKLLVEEMAIAMLRSHFVENGMAPPDELGAFDDQYRRDARAILPIIQRREQQAAEAMREHIATWLSGGYATVGQIADAHEALQLADAIRALT